MTDLAKPLYLAIEIGGTKLQIVTAPADGTIVDRQRIIVDRQAGAEGIRRQLADVLGELQGRFNWRAAGVGYGGPVDWRTGMICRSFQVEGWSGFSLGDWLRDLLYIPVVVENDSNTAALAEALLGAGRGADPVFYTNSGSGVGGGLVVGGQPYHGQAPGEAEFGHVRLDRDGTTVENRCSGWAIDRRIRAIATENPDSFLSQLLPDTPGGEAKYLGEAIAQNDTIAKRILQETADDLALGLSHVVHLFHPEVIVLGGGLALIGQAWRDAVAERLPHYIMDGFAPGPEVRLAALGEDVVPIGAILLAAEMHDD